MTNSITFNDPALDEVFQKCSPAFKSFQANLDKTSADIKNLEKFLQGCGICLYSCVQIEPHTYIAWSNATGDWRLVCESPVSDDDDDVNVKPLIECPVRIRLLARSSLSTLVAQIAEVVPPASDETEKKKPLRLFSTASVAAPTKPNGAIGKGKPLSSDEEIPF